MNLFLDIETIPSQSTAVHAKIAETVKPPSNYSKPETIKLWEQHQKPALVVDAISKTAFDGASGHIVCIGYAWDDQPARNMCIESITGERNMLHDFMAILDAKVQNMTWAAPTIVGHNVARFDLRFLWQRAIVLGVHMPVWFPRDPKPWGNEVFDTMAAFAGTQGTISLARLCEALDIQGKGDVDGSMVHDMWQAGEHEKISEYCRGDVERTRQVHRKMMVAFGER